MRRHPESPILARRDLPDVPPGLVDPTSVFNPGAAPWKGGVALLLRVQTRGRETLLVPAFSDDGVSFRVEPRIVNVSGLDAMGGEVHHVYDPRLTRIGDRVLCCVAVDVDDGCRLAVLETRDFASFDVIGFDAEGDRRNGVIFPAKVGGRYVRLERPNRPPDENQAASGDSIVLASSDDLVTWREEGEVMRGRWHGWDERIGAGPPPVRTAEGWLVVYHGIATHFASTNIYQAGAVLLDADDPTRVLARTRRNLLEPREPWELVGQVPNVVFPSGWVIEGVTTDEVARPDARIRIYYGAADTCIGLAETTISALLCACHED